MPAAGGPVDPRTGAASTASAASAAASLAQEVLSEGCRMPSSLEERETSDVVPLAVDHVYTGGGAAASAPRSGEPETETAASPWTTTTAT